MSIFEILACIVENVIVGNNVTIGADAILVKKDVPHNVTVASCPARVVSYKTLGRFIHNSYMIEKER